MNSISLLYLRHILIILLIISCVKFDNSSEIDSSNNIPSPKKNNNPITRNKKFKQMKKNSYLNFLETKKVNIDIEKIKRQFPDLESITISSPGRGTISLKEHELDFESFDWFHPDKKGDYTIIVKDKDGRHRIKFNENL